MFDKNDVSSICDANRDEITKNSPVVFALFKIGCAERDPRKHAVFMDMVRDEGAPWATADGERRDFAITKGGETMSLKELASQMSAAQFNAWMSEIPSMIDAARNPQAPGVGGALLSSIAGLTKVVGKGDFLLKTLLVSSDLTWRDDRKATSRMNVSWNGEAASSVPAQSGVQETEASASKRRPRGM